MKKILISSLIALVSAGAFADDAKVIQQPTAAENAATAAGASPITETTDKCKVVITGNDAMQYNTQEFTIDKAACTQYTVELDHVGKMPAAAMGHNVVIAKTADVEGVANDGAAAGPAKNYLKDGDERVIAHTKLIGGGEKDAVTFKTDALQAGGDYEFFCSYPGHHALMKGKVNVK